jgi:hypothetical protein
LSKYRTDLVHGSPFPASTVNALQEFIGSSAMNAKLTLASNTQIQIPAGLDNAQVGIAIGGLWRYISATATAVVSGAVGVKDIYVVASANSFSGSPAPDTDNTDYSFGLQALASGVTPTGNYNGRTIIQFRKIGEVDWDGTKITSIRQLVNLGGGSTTPMSPISPNANVTPLTVAGATSQTAPLISARIGLTGTDHFTVNPSPAFSGTIVATNSTADGYGAMLTGEGLGAQITVTNLAKGILDLRYPNGTPTGPFLIIQRADATAGYGRWTAAGLRVGDAGVPSSTLDVQGTGYFSGIVTFNQSPLAPTPTAGDSTTKLATTAFVQNAVAGLSGGSGGIAFLGNTQSFTAVNTFKTAAGAGDVAINPGTVDNAGFVAWHTSSPGNALLGYIGSDNGLMYYRAEGGAYHQFTTATATGLTAERLSFRVAASNGTFTTAPATQRSVLFEAGTLSGTTAGKVITEAATVAINAAPTAGTNMTLTNAYALWVQGGLTKLAGGLNVTGTTTMGTASATAYQVSGTALAALHLSNGTTGTGAVALAASPTFTGTVTLPSLVSTSTTLGFYGATPITKRTGYGAGSQVGTKAALTATSALNDVIAVLSSLVADMRSLGLIGV